MKTTMSKQSQQSKAFNLFRHVATSVAVHFIAAACLIFMVFTTANTVYLYHWCSVLVCALLIRALVLTMFIRKENTEELDLKKWENIHAGTTVLVSVVFAAAYSYLAMFGTPMLWAIVSLIMVMHLSCVIVPSYSSKKVMLSAILPITFPFISALTTLPDSFALIFATGIAIYTCVILVISFDLHDTLMVGFEMESKYSDEVAVNEVFREKLENSTFEDPETNILNRRFFDLMINEETRRAKRGGHSLTIALIEIDSFTEYSENYGAEKTAKSLKAIAKVLSNATPRGGEFMTRFSKNKFALIAPNVESDTAIAFTSKMMYLIYKADIEHLYTTVEDLEKVSISIGITEFTSGNIIDVEEIIGQAEQALKNARTQGGNNAQVYAANVVTPKTNPAPISPIEDDISILETGETHLA
jgi:diguanylate cyclase (GGDEF)-like protein